MRETDSAFGFGVHGEHWLRFWLCLMSDALFCIFLQGGGALAFFGVLYT